MTLLQRSCIALAVLAASPALALRDGVDYHIVPGSPAPASGADVSIEVKYFFNFSCPACNAFEAPLHLWLETKPDYVNFVMSPVPWQRSQQLYAKTFYVLEGLGRTDLTRPLFNALHKERKLLNSEGRLAGWMSDHGIDEDQAKAAYSSFSVTTKVKRAQRELAVHGIDSTPQIVVAGRYRLSPALSGNYRQMLDSLDDIVAAIRDGNPPN